MSDRSDRLEKLAGVLETCAASLRRLGDDAAGPATGLVVVGTGIRITSHLTLEALECIVAADKLHYVVAEPTAERLLRRLNPAADSLGELYGPAKSRRRSYEEMVERILGSVRDGALTCAVFYGHPGVFVQPAHAAIQRARAEGFSARMLPAVSAEDCLFADLGVDPASAGCQAFEASDFLINGRRLDPSSHVVLWQIGVIGRWDHRDGDLSPAERNVLRLLVERLGESYESDQRLAVYEASCLPGVAPHVEWTRLGRLEAADLSEVSTLYIPPGRPPRTDFYLAQTLGAV